jgi:hypothetical protein
LRRTAETLAKKKLDRGDPRSHVRHLNLDALLLPAAAAGMGDPDRPNGSEGGVEQRLAGVYCEVSERT